MAQWRRMAGWLVCVMYLISVCVSWRKLLISRIKKVCYWCSGMQQLAIQTSDGGRLRFICFRADWFDARALTLLTQHILDRVDFCTVKATPGGRTETGGQAETVYYCIHPLIMISHILILVLHLSSNTLTWLSHLIHSVIRTQTNPFVLSSGKL